MKRFHEAFAASFWDSRGSWEHILALITLVVIICPVDIWRTHIATDWYRRSTYHLIGTFMGVMAGYFGGRVDMIVTFPITALVNAGVLVALAVVAIVMVRFR